MWKSFPTTATLQRCNKRGQRHACMNYAERTAVSTKSTLQRSNKRGKKKVKKSGAIIRLPQKKCRTFAA